MRINLIISCFLLLVWAGCSFCQEAKAVSAGFQGGLQDTGSAVSVLSDVSPEELAAQVVRALLSLLGVVFIGLLIYGGFLYMTSQGAEDKIKKSKKLMVSAVIGLIIIFSAFVISFFVTQALETATLTTAQPSPNP